MNEFIRHPELKAEVHYILSSSLANYDLETLFPFSLSSHEANYMHSPENNNNRPLLRVPNVSHSTLTNAGTRLDN